MRLNERFRNASASNDLRAAGVLIRSWDALSSWGKPWLPCETDRFCAKFSDRFATSIIYPGHVDVYDGGGFVLRPNEIELNCAYAYDGGSQGALCFPPGKTAQCTPGCKRWCDPAKGVRNWGCSWHPDHLKYMIVEHELAPAGQYNEVIVDAHVWKRNLPRTIEAVYILKGAKDAALVEKSKGVHADFLRFYGLTTRDTPLVTFDQKNTHAPFELYEG